MNQLDLHGLYHYQVWNTVENFVLLNSENLPLRIITGHSEMMQDMTKKILDLHKFEYYNPPYNNGEIIVIGDKEKTYGQ